jgi:hypothetical protein
LYLRNQGGAGEVKTIKLGEKPALYPSPGQSPALLVVGRGTAEARTGGHKHFQDGDTGVRCVFSVTASSATQITEGMSRAGSPVFDREGKYLYFHK